MPVGLLHRIPYTFAGNTWPTVRPTECAQPLPRLLLLPLAWPLAWSLAVLAAAAAAAARAALRDRYQGLSPVLFR